MQVKADSEDPLQYLLNIPNQRRLVAPQDVDEVHMCIPDLLQILLAGIGTQAGVCTIQLCLECIPMRVSSC